MKYPVDDWQGYMRMLVEAHRSGEFRPEPGRCQIFWLDLNTGEFQQCGGDVKADSEFCWYHGLECNNWTLNPIWQEYMAESLREVGAA